MELFINQPASRKQITHLMMINPGSFNKETVFKLMGNQRIVTWDNSASSCACMTEKEVVSISMT